MNYRHAFHAGNFADVVKHALLTRLVLYLQRKDRAFRVYDTHAGRGLYDLSGDEALRTGEHLAGIDRLIGSLVASEPLLADYLRVIEEVRQEHGARAYPGSPLLVRRLLRRQDRLSAYELHPQDGQALAALFAGDVQAKAIALDGWLALGAHLPPKEKRGLVLIDPPYEESGEIERMVGALEKAHRRWPGGVFALWYPIKRASERQRLHDLLKASGIPDILAAEFFREPFSDDERLVGSGLAVVNPPFTFGAEAETIMAALRQVLGEGGRLPPSLVAIAAETP
ncbi:23S rRNA (adenine(2030)-N(6))-methyltransferase RlmJ [Consotaella salsifontis]|uniref:Ribosomal RNA large subunit methyltransferase J n=1 Tax=Consotaella salsifontis TaxID=1365950 RepID=A0A1T4P2X5_9HYPH|nr:23S rRNA (adenine(2030)-N(6))-methyltransferase RlmJ [Consotaella salsifontis]SJZ85667.1 23S rRNA (adenine2030-N6)-methyltransferase [Consotaella salsifontis]